MRRARGVVVLCLASACSGPPGPGASDGAAIDARFPMPRDATPPIVDGAIFDAASDGASDAGAPDASLGPLNPYQVLFVDVTSTVGSYFGGRLAVDPVVAGSGVALGDVDGDGDLDVVLARCDEGSGGPSQLLRNDGVIGTMSFTADESFAALFASFCAHSSVLVDFDWDGDLDLLVAGHGAVRLLENTGGVFSEIAGARGLAGDPAYKTISASWADLNRDGFIDVFLGRQGYEVIGSDPNNANALHLGRGLDRDFVDVTEETGLAGDGFTHAAAIADLDGDRDLDIYVANDRFSVNGVGGITDVDTDQWLEQTGEMAGTPIFDDRAADFGADGQRSAMGVALSDRNGDNWAEILVSDFGENHYMVWNPATSRYDELAAAEGLRAALGPFNTPLVSWGVRYVDFDRDGVEELLVINGATRLPVQCDDVQPDLWLRRPSQGEPFVSATEHAGLPYWVTCPPIPTDVPMGGRGVALGDLDGDGDDDMVISPYAEVFRFFRNDSPDVGHRYLRIRPVGTVIGPDPVGAVLSVAFTAGGEERRILYAGGETLTQSDRVLEVALGDLGAEAIASAYLRWPSGYVQRLDIDPGFALDGEWTVVEPEWLTLSARSATGADPAPVLTYRPVDEGGQLVGPGLSVVATRSDGLAAPVVDAGDGSYMVSLTHPGAPDYVQVDLAVDGTALAPRLAVRFE